MVDDVGIIVLLYVFVLDYGLWYSILNGDFLYEWKLFCVRELLSKLKWKIDFVVLGFFLYLLDIKLDEKEKGKLSSLFYCDFLLLCRVFFCVCVFDIWWKGWVFVLENVVWYFLCNKMMKYIFLGKVEVCNLL